MLCALAAHGVKTVVATPCFDASKQSVEAFLERREEAFSALADAIGDAVVPNVTLGAEVVFNLAALTCRGLEKLALAGTDYMLVRLPDEPKIDEEFLERFARFHIASRLNPVIADIDTCFAKISVQDLFVLSHAGALLQVSCPGLLNHDTRKCSLYLLGNHVAQFVSSGVCPDDESPLVTEAMRLLKRSLPLEKYKRIKNNAGMLLSNAARSEIV